MRIITLSREFGSGGRELGKRMAEYLNFNYYDKEIVSAVAKQGNLDEGYVQRMLESGIANQNYPITFGRTLSLQSQQTSMNLLLIQQRIIKSIAEKGDCIIVGRSADAILKDYNPFNIFVYADMAAKMKRCLDYAEGNESLSEKELHTKIRRIDQQRKRDYELCSGKQWGTKENYHLCINTTDLSIKKIVPAVAEYTKIWLERG